MAIMYNHVAYRVLRNDEQYAGCLTAKDPSAHKTLGWFLHYGKSIRKQSQFIAATLDFRVAKAHAVKDNCMHIAVINLDGLVYFDNSTKDKAKENILAYPGQADHPQPDKWVDYGAGTAAKSREVDFEKSVPAEHYFVVTLDEVLGYLQEAMRTGRGIGVLNWLLLHHKFGENK